MCEIYCDPKSSRLRVSITDRKDFYHQISISKEKSWRNTLAPSVPIPSVDSTAAYAKFCVNKGRRYNRLLQGDKLGSFEAVGSSPAEGHLWVSFGSVLQGDHLGVEVATAAYTSLLQSHGLLGDAVALRADRCLRSETQCQGLVIDDFFCISVESRDTPKEKSVASSVYRKAQAAYKLSDVLGSPQKDLDAVECGRTIGAMVNSGHEAISRNLVTLSAPPSKRLSFSSITLQVSQLTHTTDSLHLCLLGAWVSALGYRRPLLSLRDRSFHLVDQYAFDANHPKMIRLPRSVACELCLVATLMPLAVTELSAPYHPEIFCSDASDKKGAVCKAAIPEHILRVLWKSERSKGAYSRLLSPSEVLLKRMDELEASEEGEKTISPSRPLAFHFDFVEIFAGASLITKFLSEKGLNCGPPIEISASDQYNLEWAHVASWITFLVAEKRLWGFFLCPPCTTFSIMRRPALRGADCPFGYDVEDPQTRIGNILAHRGCQVMAVGSQNNAVGVLETPWSSKMKHLPAWKVIETLPQSVVIRADSCRFGSIHQKGFKFMGLNISLKSIALRCICTGPHVPVQGSYTKGSAVYTPRLAEGITDCFLKAINRMKRFHEFEHGLQVKGLENQLVNHVALTAPWEVVSSWTFRKESHINILEMASMLRLAGKLAQKCTPMRVVNLVDSYVCRCAASKGRSSSKALSTVLRRFNAISVAAGLYWTLPYCPTRWNPSDDPTRDKELRESIPDDILADLPLDLVYELSSLPKTKRWASHWVRIVILLCGPIVLFLRDRSLYRRTWRTHGVGLPPDPHCALDFDGTLGFPGEGPQFVFGLYAVGAFLVRLFCCVLSVLLLAGCCRGRCCRGFAAVVPFLFLGSKIEMAMAMPLFPKNPGEIARAASRASRPELPTGRPVLPATSSLRQRYLNEFFQWAAEEGVDLAYMLDNHVSCIDELNILLSRYGRLLYSNGTI